MKIFLLVLSFAGLLFSCGSINNQPKYQLGDDYYKFKNDKGQFVNAYVVLSEDSISVITNDKTRLLTDQKKEQVYLKPSFDIDVLVTVFKYRPSITKFPRQLTTDFNGNLYFGYRLDRFKVLLKNNPIGITRQIRHRAMSVGGFTGIGSTSISPWTTHQRTTDEYNGLILSRGIALMLGVNNLTVGIGAGWDYLTDRDKNSWIYQNKPWYGLTLSLNIN